MKQKKQTSWMKTTLFVIGGMIFILLFIYILFLGFHEYNLKEECLDICKKGGTCTFTSSYYKSFSCPKEISDNCLNKCLEECEIPS